MAEFADSQGNTYQDSMEFMLKQSFPEKYDSEVAQASRPEPFNPEEYKKTLPEGPSKNWPTAKTHQEFGAQIEEAQKRADESYAKFQETPWGKFLDVLGTGLLAIGPGRALLPVRTTSVNVGSRTRPNMVSVSNENVQQPGNWKLGDDFPFKASEKVKQSYREWENDLMNSGKYQEHQNAMFAKHDEQFVNLERIFRYEVNQRMAVLDAYAPPEAANENLILNRGLREPTSIQLMNDLYKSLQVQMKEGLPVHSPTITSKLREMNPEAFKKMETFEQSMEYKYRKPMKTWVTDLTPEELGQYKRLYKAITTDLKVIENPNPPEEPTPPQPPTKQPMRVPRGEKIMETEPAAVQVQGKIFRAQTHWQAAEKAAEELKLDFDTMPIEREGFVTTKGRFVSREEAGAIAKRKKQISEDSVSADFNTLFSEDLIGREPLSAGTRKIMKEIQRRIEAENRKVNVGPGRGVLNDNKERVEKMLSEGASASEIAKEFDITPLAVRNWIKRKNKDNKPK